MLRKADQRRVPSRNNQNHPPCQRSCQGAPSTKSNFPAIWTTRGSILLLSGRLQWPAGSIRRELTRSTGALSDSRRNISGSQKQPGSSKSSWHRTNSPNHMFHRLYASRSARIPGDSKTVEMRVDVSGNVLLSTHARRIWGGDANSRKRDFRVRQRKKEWQFNVKSRE